MFGFAKYWNFARKKILHGWRMHIWKSHHIGPGWLEVKVLHTSSELLWKMRVHTHVAAASKHDVNWDLYMYYHILASFYVVYQ